MTRYTWDKRAMRTPTRPIPTLPSKPAKYVAGNRYHAKGVPAGEQSTYWELAKQFRGGDLYAFSWDAKAKRWEVWRTEADWLATEREGKVQRPDLAELGHGPGVYTPGARPQGPRSQRASKAEVVAMLRRVLDGTDWEVSEIESLLARV